MESSLEESQWENFKTQNIEFVNRTFIRNSDQQLYYNDTIHIVFIDRNDFEVREGRYVLSVAFLITPYKHDGVYDIGSGKIEKASGSTERLNYTILRCIFNIFKNDWHMICKGSLEEFCEIEVTQEHGRRDALIIVRINGGETFRGKSEPKEYLGDTPSDHPTKYLLFDTKNPIKIVGPYLWPLAMYGMSYGRVEIFTESYEYIFRHREFMNNTIFNSERRYASFNDLFDIVPSDEGSTRQPKRARLDDARKFTMEWSALLRVTELISKSI